MTAAEDMGGAGSSSFERRRRAMARWWLDLPIRQKGLLVVALPLATLALTMVLRLPFSRQDDETTALLTRAGDTRATAQELLISLLEVESGVRGYVLTEDAAFLARFENAREAVPQYLERLSGLLAEPHDQPLYQQIAGLVDHELDLAADIVGHMRGIVSPDDPTVQEQLAEEKQVMDGIRTVLGTVRRNQDMLVAQSEAELDIVRRRFRPILFVTLFGGLSAAIAAGWLFATGVAARVTALERNAERLATSESLEFEGSGGGKDEIGSLDRALRRASVLLRTREREVKTANTELERTVHEQALLNRELEAFSYSVSHDLRAPLRSIDGFAQALREDWGDRLDETGQDHLSRIRNAAQKMGRLIDDLIKLARLTRSQIQRVDVDLTRIARDIASDLGERNPSRQVRWNIADDLRASCDPALACVLLENLLGNAWKFTSKTPDATIELKALQGTHPTLFVVHDNGAGFDMKYVEKLFAPFQRLHGDREFPGTGIGLATVQRIVHKHGGQVQTRAQTNAGATFYFTLEPSDAPIRLPDAEIVRK